METPASNFSNSGKPKKKFWEYWGIDDLDIRDPYQKGFTQIPNLILKNLDKLGIGGTKSTLAILLLYLISRDFNRKGYCYPGHSQMAIDLGTSPGTIGRNLKSLERFGLIEIGHRVSERGQTTNKYTWNGLVKKLRAIVINQKLSQVPPITDDNGVEETGEK